MIQPLPVYRRTLTGNARVRRGWRNKLVLQIEVRVERMREWPGPPGEPWPAKVGGISHEWRDATVDDMLTGTFSISDTGKLRRLAGFEEAESIGRGVRAGPKDAS